MCFFPLSCPALVDLESGEYLLNGNWIVTPFQKAVEFGGTMLEYTGSNAAIERINSTRPLQKKLLVQVPILFFFLFFFLTPPDLCRRNCSCRYFFFFFFRPLQKKLLVQVQFFFFFFFLRDFI